MIIRSEWVSINGQIEGKLSVINSDLTLTLTDIVIHSEPEVYIRENNYNLAQIYDIELVEESRIYPNPTIKQSNENIKHANI